MYRMFLTKHFPAASSSYFLLNSGSMIQAIFMLSQHLIRLHSILSTEAWESKYQVFTFSDYRVPISGTTIIPLVMFLTWIYVSHPSGAVKFRN